ncbi:monocarboxylate transporter 12-like [Strongylocentrotus purpuratus]|uniref:Monocarboxylate transporter n=1 Tax=Strongylocentrotus purpuratus TaxID=7668 RepID=A0A7M7P9W0_STRPU|nr:monocarboxylate transporter 12-like [Strongylocentrotus purpuratus]
MLILKSGGNQRFLTSCGGLCAGLALVLSFFSRNVISLSFLFFLSGFSCSLINLHATILIFQYYGGTDQFAFFSCVTVLGIPFGSMIMPPIAEKLVEAYGYSGTLLVLGGLVLNLFPVCLTFKEPRTRHQMASNSLSENVTLTSSDEGTASTEDPNATSERLYERDPPLLQNRAMSDHDPEDQNLPESDCDQETLALIDEQANNGGLSTFQSVLTSLHVYILVEEPLFTFLYLQIELTLFLATGGWAVFNVSYGLSQGLSLAQSTFLATAGGTGGLVASILVSIVLRYHPDWCPQAHLTGLVTASLFCFLQTFQATYIYLLMTSFMIGVGLFTGNMTMEPLLALVVRPENFPDGSSVYKLMLGLGYVLSGYIAGTIHDRTQSMKTVFIFLGVVLLLGVCLMATLIMCMYRRRTRDPEK